MALGKWMLAGAASLAMTGAVNAAYVTMSSTATLLDTAFSPVATDPLAIPFDSGKYIVQVDLYMQVGDLNSGAGELGFGNMAWDTDFSQNNAVVALDPDPNLFNGYAPDSTQVKVGIGFQNLWYLNSDEGVDTSDFDAMIVGIASGLSSPTDQRVLVGQAGLSTLEVPKYVGSYVLTIDSATAPLNTTETISFVPNGYSININGTLTEQPGTAGFTAPGSFGFQVVPEPASLGLLAIGGMLAMRRR